MTIMMMVGKDDDDDKYDELSETAVMTVAEIEKPTQLGQWGTK